MNYLQDIDTVFTQGNTATNVRTACYNNCLLRHDGGSAKVLQSTMSPCHME